MTDLDTFYDELAAQEIIRLAGEARRRMDFFSPDDLVRAAAELEIGPEFISAAEQLVRERQSELDDRAEFRRKQMRETTLHVCIAVPVVSIILFAHSFAVVNQLFSVLKGAMKGLSALFFSKATGHEVEFQEWRNQRLHKVKYGSTKPIEILEYHMSQRTGVRYSELYEWMVDQNCIAPITAVTVIEQFDKKHPDRIIHDEKGRGYPRVPGKTVWNEDMGVLYRRALRERELAKAQKQSEEAAKAEAVAQLSDN